MLNNLRLKLAIDLGTANTLVGVQGKGIILEEPTLIARRLKKLKKPGETICYGIKAKQMIGKEPQQIEVVHLLNQGAIADFDASVDFLRHLFKLAGEVPSRIPRFLKPEATIGVPTGITEVEKRAVSSAALQAGAGKVFLVEEPMAVAVGSGLIVDKPAGNLIIDIGGGTTEIAVVSLGGIVLNRCLKIAGNQIDEAIINFIRVKYGVLIGLPTAEKIKINLGSVLVSEDEENKSIEVKGRNLENGLPKMIVITREEVRESLSPIIQKILLALNELLEETPPELTADIAHRGIVLSGGGSQLGGLEKLIEKETKMPVWSIKNPKAGVVNGCLKLLDNSRLLKEISVSVSR
jgi:rod shape-determining protein MreB and related proteins